MAGVRYGPARIVYSGDRVRAQGYLPQGLQLLRRTQERQRLGGLNVLRDYQELDGDAYCYVILGGGMAALHIVAGYGDMRTMGVMEERTIVPDFVSGVVRNGYIEAAPRWPGDGRQVLAQFHPTLQCVDTYERWGKGIGLMAHSYQGVERLTVEPHTAFHELRNLTQTGTHSEVVYSQYVKLKPTMYSGTMRSLVQVLMGFGRQRRKPATRERPAGPEVSLYDMVEVTPTFEDVDGGVAKPTQEATAFMEEVRAEGLQIRYDWKFYRTHGLHLAADNRWWIVEISGPAGVIAMPLPLHPATTTAEFRDLLEERGDVDALAVIDKFGGFPTGEPFPAAKHIESWIRAGKVIRLADRSAVAEFYRHTAYSSDMGWAFNLSGTEAHNTAWRFGDDGVQRGVHYQALLSIGATRRTTEPQDNALKSRLEGMRGNPQFEAGIEAAIWKSTRMTKAQRDVANGSDSRVFEYVDALVLNPLATGSASVTQVSEGFLWFPPEANHDNGNIIRFPETVLGYLVSHSMQPDEDATLRPQVCDTTMHVFFAGNELKWVKFYWDQRDGGPGRNESDYEDCMYIGRWKGHQETGRRYIPMMFYTNDFDHREEMPAGTIDTEIESKDLGYCEVSVADFSPPYANEGTVSRTKRFLRRTEIWTEDSPWRGSGVAVPFHDREAYYYAWVKSSAGTGHEVFYQYTYLGDPHRYEHWRNRAPWSGGEWSQNGEGWPPSDGEPPGTTYWIKLVDHPTGYGPVTVRTVCTPGVPHTHHNWLTGANHHDGKSYFPYDCGDAADEGPWLSGGENATSLAYSIPEPPLPEPVKESTAGKSELEVWMVSSSGLGQVRTVSQPGGLGLWGWPTPDPSGLLNQYIEATCNAMGAAISARFGLTLNGESRLEGAPKYPGMESRPLTYIGVINGV